MTKFSKNLAFVVALALTAAFSVTPAHSKSFLDSINEALDSADKALDKAQKDVNKALDSVNDGLRSVSGTGSGSPSIATPPIVPANSGGAGNDSINKAVESVNNSINKTLGDADRAVNKTVNDVTKALDQVNNTISNIGKTINKGNTSIPKTGNETIDRTVNNTVNTVNNTVNTITNIFKPVQKGLPLSDAITQKALEVMAATGDAWAKLKLTEINAKNKAEEANEKYKSISWFNIFEKIKALSANKDAKKEYADAAGKLLEYEKANPKAGKFVQGIDQINETLLQFKAMLGDKKAKAQLEMSRVKKDLDAFQLKYDAAGFFEKFKLRKELAVKKQAYEKALEAFKAAGGNTAAAQTLPRVSVTQTRTGNSQPSGRIEEILPQGGNTEIQTTIENASNQVTTVINETTTVINNATGDVKALKEKVEAAYQKYVKQLGSGDAGSQTLEKLQKEYTEVLNEYKKAAGAR